MVGLLNVIPAAAGGLPGIAAAIQTARQDTFDALNLPVVPNQPSTVMPRGVVQVAVVSALNVVGAIIFPGFNHILSGAFQVPDAVAQELAATGDPVRALAAGVNAATAAVTAAGAVVADSVATAVSDIRAATGQSTPANRTVQTQNSATPTTRDERRTRQLALVGQVDGQTSTPSPAPRTPRPRRRASTTATPTPRVRRPRRRPSMTTTPATHTRCATARRARADRAERRQEGLGETSSHCVEITRSKDQSPRAGAACSSGAAAASSAARSPVSGG